MINSNNEKAEDNRTISEDFLNKLSLENGIYHPFYKAVSEHDDLVLCFRGNCTPEKVIIYYNNHIVWELYGDEDKVGISFNHARYCKSWREIRDKLGKLGFGIKDDNGNPIEPNSKGSIGMLFCKCSEKEYKDDPESFVRESYAIVREMMDVFFTPKNSIDHDFFTDKDTKQKRNYSEKRWQQKLFNDLKYSYTGLFTYDLEFAQPYGASDSQTNEPDMLAIRYEEGEPKAIVLIEVKSLYSACAPQNKKSRSDIFEHIRGMRQYSESPHIEDRINEACDILNNYQKLKLYVKDGQKIPEKHQELKVECAIIFTTADLIDIGYEMPSSKSAIHFYLNDCEGEKRIDALVNDDEWTCNVYCVGDFRKNNRHTAKEYFFPEDWK